MEVRRIVTGHDGDGNSVFLSDGPAPRTVNLKTIPGHSFAQVWATNAMPSIQAKPRDPTEGHPSLVPTVAGTSLLIVTFPPDSVMADPSFDGPSANVECMAAMPGLAETFEPDSPGMHTTETIDYAIVLEGDICLELDGGVEKLLRAKDVVIQNGTRHAWRNKTDKRTTVAFILMGAEHLNRS